LIGAARARTRTAGRSVESEDLDKGRTGARTVVREMLRGLDARFPWLARWLGGRLEIELPALTLSLLIHGLLLAGLAFAGYQVHRESQREFRSELVDNRLSSDSTFQDLDQSAERPAEVPAAGSFAPNLAATITSAPSSAGGVPVSATREDSTRALAPELARLDVRRATEVVVPTAKLLGQTVSIRGNGAETVGGVEGAVDRIATEIIRHLEQGPTLVVWAFDASGSLLAERQRLGKHIETVYAHIKQLDESSLAADSGLMTMVVAFGKERKAMLPKPTDDLSEVLTAVRDVPLDETGEESTFTTVGEIVNKWGHYKGAHNHPYRTMVIVVTDEKGDDEIRLEDAIAVCRRAKVPVYVLGSQAIFGRPKNYVTYVDPETKQVYNGLAVDQGPESIMPEQIHLPFWYDGPQYDILESGFGPYALSRLAAETGGIYFITRFDTRRMGFDPARMREYRPDWIPRAAFVKQVEHSPLRQAVLNAAQITQQRLPSMPSLFFPPADAPEFKDAMAANQAIAERTAYTVDEALQPITAVAKLRNHEPSRRWQAHYDLIRGRLLAMKVRCYEYNWACARMKKDPQKFSNPRSNAWRLAPDTAIRYSDKAAAAAREADALLRRVVNDHPATPWALLAQRELKDSLGFKWVESYVPPIRRNNNDAAAKKKKNDPKPAKPAEPPKL
jgi:von Willebrand factor type A domain